MVIGTSRPALRATARNLLPSPSGAGVTISELTMPGLYVGSLVWSATTSKTVSTDAAMSM
nr:hypothetical protein [Nocardioides ungokensis]